MSDSVVARCNCEAAAFIEAAQIWNTGSCCSSLLAQSLLS